MSEKASEGLTTKEEIIEAAKNAIAASTSTSPELNQIVRALLTSPDISPEEKTELFNGLVKEWTYTTTKWQPDLRGIDISSLPGLDLSDAIQDK